MRSHWGKLLRVKFAPALGLGALTLGPAAWAQDAAPERRVDLGASAVTTYESNLLRLPDNAVVGLGREREDLRFTPSVTIDLQVPLGRQSVYLNGLAGYDFYKNNDDLDSERIELNGGSRMRLSSCSAQLGLSYARRQSDLADFLTAVRIENVENRVAFDGLLTCESAAGLKPSFGFGHERVGNSDDFRRTGNYSAETYTAGIAYGRPWLGDIGLDVSYRRGRYDDRPAVLGNNERIDSYTAGINLSRKVGSQLTGSASLGFTRVDPSLAGVPGFKGLSWSLDLVWNPGTRFQAAVGASRDVQQSNLLDVSYAIVDDYRGRIDYALGDRVRLSLTGNHSRRSLRDSPLTPGGVLSGNDRTYRLSAAASYTPSYRLSFSLNAAAEKRKADNRLLDYDNFLVAVTTRLTV